MSLPARDRERLTIVSERWKLTTKETRVLGEWAFTENSVDQIARMYGNAVSTIRHHIRNIRLKASVHNRTELVRSIYRLTQTPRGGNGRIHRLR